MDANEFQRIATQICVSDIERSTQFYCEGFGFTPGPLSGWHTAEAGSEISKMFALPQGATFQSRHLHRYDGGLEMIQFEEPAATGDKAPKLNQHGAKGMLYNCPDAAVASARLVELGATLIYGGKDGATGQFLSYFLYDPDGIRIQLVSLPPDILKAVRGGF
jgi:catechol 2,3-dioxygenase-like lactoylglutathione lyase family enzyme